LRIEAGGHAGLARPGKRRKIEGKTKVAGRKVMPPDRRAVPPDGLLINKVKEFLPRALRAVFY